MGLNCGRLLFVFKGGGIFMTKLPQMSFSVWQWFCWTKRYFILYEACVLVIVASVCMPRVLCPSHQPRTSHTSHKGLSPSPRIHRAWRHRAGWTYNPPEPFGHMSDTNLTWAWIDTGTYQLTIARHYCWWYWWSSEGSSLHRTYVRRTPFLGCSVYITETDSNIRSG